MYRAYVGGVGGGKTLWGDTEGLSMSVRFPGTAGLIGRQYYTELKDSTMRTFFEEVCPEELIESFHKADMRLVFKPINGRRSTIVFRPLEDFKKIKSMKLGWFFMDEADESPEETFFELCRRLRHHFGPNRGWLAANDEGRNWVYHLFHPNGNRHNSDLYRLFVAYTKENRHLPPGYIEALYKGMPDEMIARYLEPQFQLIGGAVYKEWNPDQHIVDPFPIPERWPLYRVIDPGVTNVTACLIYTVDEAGTYYFIDEFYEAGVTVETAVEGILKICSDFEDQILYTLIDPAACRKTHQKYGRHWSVSDEYNEHGIFCIPASNDVAAGIHRVRSYLKNGRLKIFRNCENLIDEFPDYAYRKPRNIELIDEARRERVKKVRDHALDCLRYAVSDLSESATHPPPKLDWYMRLEKTQDWMLAGVPGA
jgi:phage terminase large subunit